MQGKKKEKKFNENKKKNVQKLIAGNIGEFLLQKEKKRNVKTKEKKCLKV